MGFSSFRVRGFRVPGRALFERHPGGIGFHSVVYDATGRAVDYTFDAVNPAFERLTGLEARRVVGKTAGEVFRVPDPATLNRLREVADRGTDDTFELWTKALDRHLRVTVFGHAPGKFTSTLEAPTAAGRPGSSAGDYRTFFELPNAVKLIIDPESHRILDADPSAEAFYGWTRDELRSMRIDDINLMAPDRLASVVREAGAQGSKHYFFQHRTRDGSVRDVEVFTTLGPWGAGKANYAIVHDITERRQLERTSLQSERLKTVGELTASLYHEFGNLLGILFGQIQLLELQIPEGDSKQRVKAQIDGQLTRARRLIESVKRFSRDQGLERTQCRLVPLLEDLLEVEGPACRRAGVSVVFSPCEGDLVDVDGVLVQQVFLNLFKNALEALAQTREPRIRIAVTLEAHDVVVRFTNNGPTIAPEDRPHLFTRFFTTKAEPGAEGTGLGLSFSQSVIVSHGGALLLESTPETTFQVRLPRAGS